MKFVDFLKENTSEDLDKRQLDDKDDNTDDTEGEPNESSNSLMDKLKRISSNIAGDAKRLKIFTVKDLYVIDYKNEKEEIDTPEIIGYFLYKDTLDKQDDYYISRFVYDVKKDSVDIDVDPDNRESISTIADAEIQLTRLKTTKFEV